MELLTQINRKLPADENSNKIISKLKEIIFNYDKTSEIILFGSRARGDWSNESDWDFLILTGIILTEKCKDELRIKILNQIELPLDETVFVIVKNKIDWEDSYAVTNIYQSISEDGIAV